MMHALRSNLQIRSMFPPKMTPKDTIKRLIFPIKNLCDLFCRSLSYNRFQFSLVIIALTRQQLPFRCSSDLYAAAR